MSKKIAKKKTLTLRLNATESKEIDQLMVFTGKNTASRALLHAAQDYISLNRKRDHLEEDLRELENKHSDLVEDINEGLSAYSRVMKAIDNKQ